MNKEVIFIVNKLHGGGAERVISILSNKFAENNIKTTVCTYSQLNKMYINNDKIDYRYISSNNNIKLINKINRVLLLRKIFKEKPNATIIAFEYFINMQTIIAALLLKNKVIVSERNDPNIINNRFVMKKLRNLLYRFADILVCQTDDARDYFSKVIQEKSIIIPNPVMSNLPTRFTGERTKEIVTFCRLEPQKNLKMMINSFDLLNKDYPEYKLFIYGDGSKKQELINYVKSKNLSDKVRFYGFVDNIHSKIIDKAMFVSSSDYEGISNSMLEALSIGLPCVVTDCPCGGARMMIKNNENGILVPVGDHVEMYKGMKKIIENKELSKKISINAMKIRESLSEEKIFKMWVDLL